MMMLSKAIQILPPIGMTMIQRIAWYGWYCDIFCHHVPMIKLAVFLGWVGAYVIVRLNRL